MLLSFAQRVVEQTSLGRMFIVQIEGGRTDYDFYRSRREDSRTIFLRNDLIFLIFDTEGSISFTQRVADNRVKKSFKTT